MSSSWIDQKESRVNLAVDESAIAKSAAWAWLQQGSNGQPIREFEVWRKKIKSKPSRYKLEALQKNVPKITSKPPAVILNSPIGPTEKSLFDSYEIERISRQLDYYIKSSHAKHHGRDSEVTDKNEVVRKTKKIATKGFRLRLHIPACGSSIDDVVESRKSVAGHRRGAASVHNNQGGRF